MQSHEKHFCMVIFAAGSQHVVAPSIVNGVWLNMSSTKMFVRQFYGRQYFQKELTIIIPPKSPFDEHFLMI